MKRWFLHAILTTYYVLLTTEKGSLYGSPSLISSRFQLTNSVLEGLAGLEGRNLHRRDADLLRRIARVHTHASLALADAERTETGHGDIVTLLEFLRDRTDESCESVCSGTLGDAGCVCDRGDQILLRHAKGGGRNKMSKLYR